MWHTISTKGDTRVVSMPNWAPWNNETFRDDLNTALVLMPQIQIPQTRRPQQILAAADSTAYPRRPTHPRATCALMAKAIERTATPASARRRGKKKGHGNEGETCQETSPWERSKARSPGTNSGRSEESRKIFSTASYCQPSAPTQEHHDTARNSTTHVAAALKCSKP